MFASFKKDIKVKKRRKKIIKAIKKKAAETQKIWVKPEEEVKFKDIEMETDKVTREGDVALKFNQKMVVPAVITGKKPTGRKQRALLQRFDTCPATNKRRLVGLSELDVSRDVLDVTFVTLSDQEAKPIKYYLDMRDWHTMGLGIKINFEDPLQVGKGND